MGYQSIIKRLTFLFFLFISLSSQACLNEYTINKNGHESPDFWGVRTYYRSFDTDFSQDFVNLFDLDKKENYSFEDLSDVGVHLTHLKKFDEALSLFLWLYERHPEEYSIVANLGTTYELTGNVDSALFYIEKSIEINPEAHSGSEWFHVSVLKAKKEMVGNPGWLLKHNVLNLNITSAIDPESEEYYERENIENQISMQLVERIPFMWEPNLLMANILKEYGQMVDLQFSVTDALIIYQMAEYYDPEDVLNIKTLTKQAKLFIKKNKLEKKSLKTFFPAIENYREIDKKQYPQFKNSNNPENFLDEDYEELERPEGTPPSRDPNNYIWFGIIILALGGLIFISTKRRRY